MSKLLPLFLIVCISTVAQAASVYRWVDNDGQIHYSDHPTNGSESVELRESSVYTPRELPDISQDEEAADTDEEEGLEGEESIYESLRVVVPDNDETVPTRSGYIWMAARLPVNSRPPRLRCRTWNAVPTPWRWRWLTPRIAS